jgi:hypothetical protein
MLLTCLPHFNNPTCNVMNRTTFICLIARNARYIVRMAHYMII